jgi:hypothetical protein
VYKKKEAASENEGEKFRACLSAKDYSQRKVLDYDKIYLLMIKYTSIKIVLGLVAHFDMQLE